MLTAEQLKQVQKEISFLRDAPEKVLKDLQQTALVQQIAAGETVFREGDACPMLAVLLDGRIRVFKESDSGREITLYRFANGEGCILTASCIMSKGKFPALALVEESATALLIPANALRDWVERYPVWQRFVFGTLARRLGDVIATIEEVAFKRMDHRLADLLLRLSDEQGSELDITHQQLATELGTAREVVTRLLKDFANRDLLQLERSHISVINHSGLKKILDPV